MSPVAIYYFYLYNCSWGGYPQSVKNPTSVGFFCAPVDITTHKCYNGYIFGVTERSPENLSSITLVIKMTDQIKLENFKLIAKILKSAEPGSTQRALLGITIATLQESTQNPNLLNLKLKQLSF